MQGKDPTPLFEIIHKAPRGPRRGVRVPEWIRRADEMERQVETAEPTVPPDPSAPPAWRSWWSRPIRFRLQSGVLALAGTAMLALVVVAFLIGMRFQERLIRQEQIEYVAIDQTLDPVREKPANRALIPTSVERNLPVTGGAAPPRGAGAAGDPADPREPGLNYFRLVTLPDSAVGEGQKAVSFLQSQGVDAVLIPVNNGRSYKLIALPGFTRIGSPEAKKFEDRLKSLGRLWKSGHRGSSDWNDLLAEKYKPGVN